MLCRHFPPSISGGARRPYLFAKTLTKLGCKITVVAPRTGSEDEFDIHGVTHNHPDPATTSKIKPSFIGGIRNWIRKNFLLPDPDVLWAWKVYRQIKKQPMSPPDWIYTSSPPESLLFAGWFLKKYFKCYWVADFRDSWFEEALRIERKRKGIRVYLERQLARYLLGKADATISVTEFIARELSSIQNEKPNKVIGHFSDKISGYRNLNLSEDVCHIVHTGSFSLSDPDRRIEPVIEAFKEANNERLHLHLIGRLSDDEIRQISEYNSSGQIKFLGPVDLQTSRDWQAAADVLLLIAAEGVNAIPGKLAEYQATGKPILLSGGGSWKYDIPGLLATNDLSAAFSALPSNLDFPKLGAAQTAEEASQSLLHFLDECLSEKL